MDTMNKVLSTALFTLATALLSPSAMASDFDYQGFGGWRTYDHHGNPLPDASGDRGYARNTHSVEACKQLCRDDHQCKGVEVVAKHHGGYTCEVHHDELAYCDTRGGSKRTHGEDGCHVKKHPHNPQAPEETHSRDPHTGKCYAWNWDWITFANYHRPNVHVDPHQRNALVTKFTTAADDSFKVIVHHDCSISLKSRYNHRYVSNYKHNHYQLRADGKHIGIEDKYKVYRAHDGRYLFKSKQHRSWVFTDHNHKLRSTPHAHSNWEDRKYHVNVTYK